MNEKNTRKTQYESHLFSFPTLHSHGAEEINNKKEIQNKRERYKRGQNLRRRSSKDRSGFGLAQSNRDAMDAPLVGVPVVESRCTVPGHEVFRRPVGGRVGGTAVCGGGGKDGMVLEGNPLHFLFRREGARLNYIGIVQIEVKPHFASSPLSPPLSP